jgi:hypothetical protein
MNGPANQETRGVVRTRELMAGGSGIVLASLTAVVLSPEPDLRSRVLIMAVGCGLLSAVLSDWLVALAVTVVSAGVFITVLAGGAPGRTDPWGYTPIFAVSLLVGAGNRQLRHVTAAERDH